MKFKAAFAIPVVGACFGAAVVPADDARPTQIKPGQTVSETDQPGTVKPNPVQNRNVQGQPVNQNRPGAAAPVAGQNQTAGAQVTQETAHQLSDRDLATCVSIGNQKEIALARFAQDKAEHQDVKKFAEMMVKDHQAFLAKLEQFAPTTGQDADWLDKGPTKTDDSRSTRREERREERREAVANRKDDKKDDATAQKQTTGFRGETQGAVTPEQLGREMAQQCLSSAKEKLSEKKGAEFDQCFMGMQIAGHMAMHDQLTVLERHASGELAQVLAAGRKTTETHLKHAEQIMEKLSKSADREETKAERRDAEKSSDNAKQDKE
jgi:predicted outer membrane protein